MGFKGGTYIVEVNYLHHLNSQISTTSDLFSKYLVSQGNDILLFSIFSYVLTNTHVIILKNLRLDWTK